MITFPMRKYIYKQEIKCGGQTSDLTKTDTQGVKLYCGIPLKFQLSKRY